MSKKKTQAEQPQKPEQPGYVTELLEKGTVILTADDREDFGQLIDQIPAEVRYAAGAIQKDTRAGLFLLRIEVIND